MKIAVVAETEEVELQGLTLDHTPFRDVGNRDRRKIRLSRNRTETRELRAIELDPIILVRMLILKGFQKMRRVVLRILRMLLAEMRDAFHLIIRACHRCSFLPFSTR